MGEVYRLINFADIYKINFSQKENNSIKLILKIVRNSAYIVRKIESVKNRV